MIQSCVCVCKIANSLENTPEVFAIDRLVVSHGGGISNDVSLPLFLAKGAPEYTAVKGTLISYQ